MQASTLLIALLSALLSPFIWGSPLHEPRTPDAGSAAKSVALSQTFSTAGTTSFRPSTHLRKRAFISFEDWFIHIDEWDFVHPVPRAAEMLAMWYERTYRLINTDFQFRDEMQHFVIENGPFRMRFDCEQGTIEWLDVAFILDLLAGASQMGWEGLYQLRFRHARSAAVIKVSLSMLWYGGGGGRIAN